jgi:hypothetical protein
MSRPAAASSYSGVVDVSVLHFAASDYVAARTPAENAKADWADVIVSGTVEGFTAGRSHRIAPNSPPAHKIVLRVNVDQKLKGAAKYTTDGKVYVELWAGSDANPARFEKAVPKGTKVVVFGSEVLIANDAGTDGADNGHPVGTLLLSGLHPQSLFFEGIPATALTTKSGAAITPTVIPGQESLQDFGPEWTKIQTLGGLLGAIKAGLNGS